MRFIDLKINRNIRDFNDSKLANEVVGTYMIVQATILNVPLVEVDMYDEIDERVIEYFKSKKIMV